MKKQNREFNHRPTCGGMLDAGGETICQDIWSKAIDLLIETEAFNVEPLGVDIDNRVIKLVATGLLNKIEECG
jgi:hypothetical protein